MKHGLQMKIFFNVCLVILLKMKDIIGFANPVVKKNHLFAN